MRFGGIKMKKYVDGKYLEMTPKEIQENKNLKDELVEIPSFIERIEAIEAVLLEGVLLDG